jgi:Kdo2-lipid IVA lauroyltransferase/acyltransferase
MLRHRLELLALRIGVAIVPLLSRWTCYQIGQFLGAIGSVVDRKGRRVALSNLEAALGDQFSVEERRKIVRRSYQNFANTMLDLLWSPRLTKENFQRYIEVDNVREALEQAERIAVEKRSGIIASSIHYGNFEWLHLTMGFLGYPGVVVVEAQMNSTINPILEKARTRSGHTIIPRKGAIMRLYKTLRRGGRVALLVDLTVLRSDPAVVIECFGLKTHVTLAHAWLHHATGAPVLPAHCQPLPGGRYRIVCHPRMELPASATAAEIAQACWDCFEPIVRKDPAPWLWMYKHWRFRPANAQHSYPFYANESPDFEKLLQPLERDANAATSGSFSLAE